jgi:aldehyde:ferredoxin oxidoreductase
MWEGNILSQKLGINNFELSGVMWFLARGIETGAVKMEDTGLSSIPMIDRRSEPGYGGEEAHHEFLAELLGGIADGSSPFTKGTARVAEEFGQSAVDLYNTISPAWGNRSHHIWGVAEALHWSTDTRDPFNSCHDYLVGLGNSKEIADWFGVPGGHLAGMLTGNIYEGTERETVWVQNHQCLKNSLLICNMASWPAQMFHPPEMDIRIFESRVLSATTGIDYDVGRLWEAGERIWNLRRAIMVLRENRHRDEDTISNIWFEEVLKLRERLSEPLDRERWETLKNRYYELRGWDVAHGWPTRAKLEELGMKAVADELTDAGRIGQG